MATCTARSSTARIQQQQPGESSLHLRPCRFMYPLFVTLVFRAPGRRSASMVDKAVECICECFPALQDDFVHLQIIQARPIPRQ